MEMNDLVQGSDEWLAWRRDHLTASDAATVMGVAPTWSPARTWEDLRQLKAGEEPERGEFLRKAADRGIDREHDALALHTASMNPACVTEGQYAASLDGLSLQGRMWAEVKAPVHGHQSHMARRAREEGSAKYRVLPHVWWQLVHQAHILREACDLCLLILDFGNEGMDDAIIEIPTKVLLEDWPLLRDEWERFSSGVPQGRHDPAWVAAATEWKEAVAQSRAASDRLSAANDALLELGDGEGSGVKVKETTRRGTIDWKRVAQHVYEGSSPLEQVAEQFRRNEIKVHNVRASNIQ